MSEFTEAVNDVVGGNFENQGVMVVGDESDIFGFGGNVSKISALKDRIHNTVTKVPASASYWETDIEIIESCGDQPESIDVFMYPIVKAKINTLMSHYVKMEWLAYFTGEKVDGLWHIKDLVIPEQKVNPVSVYDIQDPGVAKIGVVHSHHDMGNKFSHTDDEYINQNNDISLCVCNSGIQGHVRVKTSCGKYVLVKANIVDFIEDFDLTGFVETFDEKIKVVKFVPAKNGNVRYVDDDDDDDGNESYEFMELMDSIDNYQKKLVDDVQDDVYPIEEYQHIVNIISTLRHLDDIEEEMKYDSYVNLFLYDSEMSIEACDMIDEVDQDATSITAQEYSHLKILSDFLIDRIEKYFENHFERDV